MDGVFLTLGSNGSNTFNIGSQTLTHLVVGGILLVLADFLESHGSFRFWRCTLIVSTWRATSMAFPWMCASQPMPHSPEEPLCLEVPEYLTSIEHFDGCLGLQADVRVQCRLGTFRNTWNKGLGDSQSRILHPQRTPQNTKNPEVQQPVMSPIYIW